MIRCIAIDDEPLALQQIASYIKRTPFLELVTQCKSAVNAIEVLQNENIDLMFVDINMPDITGLELVKSLNKPIMIIFTTAYSEYAIEGFKVDAVDYLLKPFGYDEFLKSAMKVKARWDLQQQAAAPAPTSQNTEVAYIFIKVDTQRVLKVPFADIIYVEGHGEYTSVMLSDNSEHVLTLSVKLFEQGLCAECFMRIHKSYIININHVKEINYNRAIMSNGKKIPIGEIFRKQFYDFINKNIIKR